MTVIYDLWAPEMYVDVWWRDSQGLADLHQGTPGVQVNGINYQEGNSSAVDPEEQDWEPLEYFTHSQRST